MYEGLKFKTKAEVLRWLGKDSKDVRLIDRMMRRGEITKEGDEYVLPLKNDIKSLIDLLMELCEENEKEGMLKVVYKVLYNLGK